MRYASCPTAVVEVPVDRVWALLMAPAGWGDVFDMRLLGVDPPGRAAVGQVIRGETGLKILHLRLAFRMLEIDSERHRLRMTVDLPFGLVVDEEIGCTSLDHRRCRVAYRCNFDFPGGWRGAALRTLLARRLDSGPADSLSRLKSAAERRFYGS
jgi:Polyketide cyclase / dehydrase and lipid transport